MILFHLGGITLSVVIDELYAGIAVIIFNAEGHVFLQQRLDVGQWGIPSGHVEKGETVTQAVVREMKEETGLDVEVTRLIGVYSDPDSQIFEYPNGKNVHFITNCFEAVIIGGELIVDPKESLDYQFFPTDQLPANLLRMHPRWLADALEQRPQAFIR